MDKGIGVTGNAGSRKKRAYEYRCAEDEEDVPVSSLVKKSSATYAAARSVELPDLAWYHFAACLAIHDCFALVSLSGRFHLRLNNIVNGMRRLTESCERCRRAQNASAALKRQHPEVCVFLSQIVTIHNPESTSDRGGGVLDVCCLSLPQDWSEKLWTTCASNFHQPSMPNA